jgi:hypothetical protein
LLLFIEEVAKMIPDGLEMEPDIKSVTLEPGEAIDFEIRGQVERGRTACFAIETLTDSGPVVSGIIELHADDDGVIHES